MATPRDIAREAARGVDRYGLAGMIKRYGVGGVFLAIAYALINGIQSIGETITAPFRAFWEALAELIYAIIGAPVTIIEDTAIFTGFTLTQGEWSFFGPFTFAIGVFATMAGLYVFTVTIRRLELRPWRLFKGLR